MNGDNQHYLRYGGAEGHVRRGRIEYNIASVVRKPPRPKDRGKQSKLYNHVYFNSASRLVANLP